MKTLKMLEKDRDVLCWFYNSPPITSGKKATNYIQNQR